MVRVFHVEVNSSKWENFMAGHVASRKPSRRKQMCFKSLRNSCLHALLFSIPRQHDIAAIFELGCAYMKAWCSLRSTNLLALGQLTPVHWDTAASRIRVSFSRPRVEVQHVKWSKTPNHRKSVVAGRKANAPLNSEHLSLWSVRSRSSEITDPVIRDTRSR